MTEETTFYSDDKGVRITNTRAILGSATYAMSNITSVMKAKKPANQKPAIVIVLIGIFILLISIGLRGTIGIIVAAFMVIGGFYMGFALLKPSYAVKIGSASGESVALESADEKYTDAVVHALNEAIVKRS